MKDGNLKWLLDEDESEPEPVLEEKEEDSEDEEMRTLKGNKKTTQLLPKLLCEH